MIQYFPIVTGSLTVSGSLLVSGGITASGGISISGSIASASFASTASFVALAQSASNAVAAQTASFVALAQSASNAVVAQTASYANNLTVAGTLTAQTLVVQTITSSVSTITGSTNFGSLLANTHQFTGSVSMTGSLAVVTTGTELQVTNTGVRIGNAITDAHPITGSVNISGSLNGIGATFRVSTDRNLATRFDSNIVLSAQSDSGAPESLRVYADTFRLFTATTVVGLTERFTISNTGAATFSSTIYTPNFISSDTEFRLGAAFARVATLDAGGGFGGGYNLNWNNGSPIHNSTGTISGYAYANDGSVRFYANTSNAANTAALLRFNIGSDGSIAMGNFSPSGTPTADYRSFEIGRQGNTIAGAPWKSNLYLSTNATITAGSTAFTYRNSGVVASFFGLEGGEMSFSNASSGTAGNTVSFTERMRITSTGRVVAPFGYQSFKGSISLTASQTATIYTMPQASAADGVYYVYCRLNGGAAIYMASAIVTALAANNELFISNTRTGANVGLSVSGRDIRITNGGFGTFTWQWSILFQPVD